MPRFDISRLRKENGMSQGELANLLQITQSFLSAIETGRSPLPIEKEGRLCEIFGITDLNNYILDRQQESGEKKLTEMTDSDLFNQLLSRFHKQAHSAESEHHHHDHHHHIDDLQQKLEALYIRNEALMGRIDKLNEDNDRLRMEIDSYREEIENLRKENFNLKKELLEKGR
ncbi:MAG: helix-turn-helix domain-containing protein [Muribaculaceae bacterium]|nr:helix-turn-helix domain-containing protein [Muribaculaceae bacterium]